MHNKTILTCIAASGLLASSVAFAQTTSAPASSSDATTTGRSESSPVAPSNSMQKQGGSYGTSTMSNPANSASENKQTPTGGQPGGSANQN